MSLLENFLNVKYVSLKKSPMYNELLANIKNLETYLDKTNTKGLDKNEKQTR